MKHLNNEKKMQKKFNKTYEFDNEIINFLSEHLKETIENKYDVSYNEITLLNETEQDKIINNINNIKTKKKTNL